MVLDGEENIANCSVKRVIMEGIVRRSANVKTTVSAIRRRGSVVAHLRGREEIARNDAKRENGERAAKKVVIAVIVAIVTC